MNHIIVGTAGHIDHGKTTLIKALTGIDTDRLEEEKKRGISIDLGFTHFDISPTEKIGIIDVPGHEKFLKNMLAGVSGMDMILLVVSADEGVMPQTREHLDILDLIGMKTGIIVVTKIDKVEEEFLPLVEEDIRESIQGTFLGEAPLVFVDSISRKGLNQLVDKIKELSYNLEGRDNDAPPRMNIDRIFSVKGFGSVVTGTLVEGTINVGDELTIYPKLISAKVRGIQVHNLDSEQAFAGQRVAINLANVDKDKIERGDVLAKSNMMTPTMMIDGKIRVVKSASKDIEHWDRIRVYHGAREILGRIVPLEDNLIPRGGEAYAQIRLEEELACKAGDKIVIRLYSPMETIAGGIIIDANPKKHSTANEDLVESLELKAQGDQKEVLENFLISAKDFVEIKTISEKLSLTTEFIKINLKILEDEKRAFIIQNLVAAVKTIDKIAQDCKSLLEGFHQRNPLRLGINREELKSRLKLNLKPKEYDILIEELINREVIKVVNSIVSIKYFEVSYSEAEKKIRNDINGLIKQDGLMPRNINDIIKTKESRIILESLIEQGQLIRVDEDLIYHKDIIQNLKADIAEIIKSKGSLELSDFKEKYGLSRKFTIALLEYFDRINFTKRLDGKRVLNK
ncbi:MAG: selenocysteine-specific translation elongation factor [Filifactoraceae bacterium]